MQKKYKIYNDTIEQGALNQFFDILKLPMITYGALMPDAHLGSTMPIGGVVNSNGFIFPSFIGFDIGCGMGSYKLNLNIKDKEFTSLDLEKLKSRIIELIPIGMNKFSRTQKYEKRDFSNDDTKLIFDQTWTYQVGTLGGGNHFIEIGVDKEGYLNITIHSGSRGLGHKLATYYMKIAAIKSTDESRYEMEFDMKNKDNPSFLEKNPVGYAKAKKEFVYRRTRARLNTNIEGAFGLDIQTVDGQNYLQDLNATLDRAVENRETMLNNVKKAIEEQIKKGGYNFNLKVERYINRNHNHAEVKESGIVHRKGATHADEGMYGIIPGNMRDGCFVVIGKGNEEALCSSSHGAGRVLSRSKAKEQLSVEEFKKQMVGIVSNHTDHTIDEAPNAYKNIFEVMDLQKDLVENIDLITPILNIKG
jgi:tRNA-splicing ligase RtcB